MQVDERKNELISWLEGVFDSKDFSCEPASSDASFRRYFRVVFNDFSYVVMDAPPDKEDCVPFITIAGELCSAGIQAPTVYHQNLEKGFLVLSDFGSTCYLDVLNTKTSPSLYSDATKVLHQLHQIPTSSAAFPDYSQEMLSQEVGLFSEWFLEGLLGVTLSKPHQKTLEEAQTLLVSSAVEQPQVVVHRDFHCRNLMVTTACNPGVIDFQDAVIGPITYDLVSLYRDCYIDWPTEAIDQWLDTFLSERAVAGLKDEFSKEQFYQWFDLMGVQRHMKAIGIFSRLLLRDGKSGYLADIPRTLNYVIQVSKQYPALSHLHDIITHYDVEKSLNVRLKEHGVL